MKTLLTLALTLLSPALAQTGSAQTASMPQGSASKDSMPHPDMTKDKMGGDKMSGEKMGSAMMHSLTGSFNTLHAPTTGQVSLTPLSGGYALRISHFRTEPAPDLHVWLFEGAAPQQDTKELKKQPHLDLGVLKTTSSSASIKLPAGVKPDKYHSVVLWCDQFSTAFAAADLK